MKKQHILLLTGLLIMTSLSGCCTFFDCRTHKYRGQYTICQQLLDDYKMTAQDLRGLEVHLNQELLMKRLYSKKVGTADSRFRSLRMEDTETYEFIRFKTSYRGTIQNVGDLQLDFIDSLKELIKEKLGQPHRILLEVSFEEGWILSFISTDSGGFELNTSPGGKNIWYQDIKYDSVYGGAGNSLVVDGDYFYDFYMNFQNPGRENFKDYHSERWR